LCETVVYLSAGMAAVLEVEDEPEEKYAFNSLHEHARLEELARRNSLYLPHLRSAYPLEVFSTGDDIVTSRSNVARSRSNVSHTESLPADNQENASRHKVCHFLLISLWQQLPSISIIFLHVS